VSENFLKDMMAEMQNAGAAGAGGGGMPGMPDMSALQGMMGGMGGAGPSGGAGETKQKKQKKKVIRAYNAREGSIVLHIPEHGWHKILGPLKRISVEIHAKTYGFDRELHGRAGLSASASTMQEIGRFPLP